MSLEARGINHAWQDENGNELIDEELTIIEARKFINQLKSYLENGTE